jgi:hypothetical protein
MKGAVLAVCPEATLVDISHDVPPRDVLAAALELAAAFRYFPAGAIFLAVVDPGVGSGRRGIAVEAGAYRFVAPDNGILSAVLDEFPPARMVELTDPRFVRPEVSRTFEGRDRFGPVAGWLARGVPIRSLGGEIETIERLDVPRPRVSAREIEGQILRVDRFGNLTTNIHRRQFEQVAGQGAVAVRVGERTVVTLASTYADVAPGELCVLVGSTGHLEIAAGGASAAEILGAGRATAVRVTVTA